MSATFFITLVVALMAIVYWRVVLVVAGALVLALVGTGISSISDAVAGQQGRPAATAPAEPGAGRDGSAPAAGGAAPGDNAGQQVPQPPPR